MAESSQTPERPHKDPVRIVYHAQNRTFARLFKERSLDQLKDVVRRKLGLGPEIDVSLKQMGPDALLDLDDDDDFQAFRVLLKSSTSADIQVTVGGSQGDTVPHPIAPQSSAASITSEESLNQSRARPKTTSVTESSPTTKKSELSARKRKVSFDETPAATSNKSTERHTQSQPVAATPVSTPKTAETPTVPKSTHPEEPPKKKPKKDIVKAKDAQAAEGVEGTATKASTTRKPRAKKSAVSDGGTEAAASVSKDGEPSEPPAKKSGKRKKDDGTLPKKSSALPDPDGMDRPVSEPNPINDASVQPPSERRRRSGVKGGASKTGQGEKTGVCAAIPRTSASVNVQSEVTAAILADIISKGSGPIPPPPPKRKPTKTKKPSASSSTLLSTSAVANTSSGGAPDLSTEPGLEQGLAANDLPPQTREPNGPMCPICLGEPFHIRYRCPVVLRGADAVRKRLEEVKKSNTGDQQSLIKELEGLLRDTKVTSEPPSDATPHEVQPQETLQPSNASASRTPNIPSNSNLSEVAVEGRGEGSSSESSDNMSEGGNKHDKGSLAPVKRKTSDKQLSPSNDDLEAVIRGPVSRRKSLLYVIDRIAEDEENKDSESEEDEEEIEEEDQEEEIDRSLSRLSKHISSSSEPETEEEEEKSTSRLPSPPAEDNGEQGLNGPVEKSKSPEHPGQDVVMGDSIDPAVPQGQDDGSSEETHVGSDRMVVDSAVGEKVANIVEEQISSLPSKASVPEPLGGRSNKPQEPMEREADPSAKGDSREPAPGGAEVDPIEPADDAEPTTTLRSSNSDPIEVLPDDGGSLFAGANHSIPKPGVTKKIKTRDGRVLGDEAEYPVLLEQLPTPMSEEVTPLPTKGKPRKKVMGTPASQEQVSARKRTRSSSLLQPTSTPAAVTLLSHKPKVGASTKTPAKRQINGSQTGTKDIQARNSARTPSNLSIVNWETLAEPSSPSLQLDGSMLVDELRSSSQPEDNAMFGRLNAESTPAQKERLFDLTSSQIPFPYSQHKPKPTPAFLNGKGKEAATDSESEHEAKATKKKAKRPSAYRPLSQLASHAVQFTPSLPTPTNKSVMNTKSKKRAANEDSSSSSDDDDDDDEANESIHIPQGRRAGAKLEQKKRKNLLSRV